MYLFHSYCCVCVCVCFGELVCGEVREQLRRIGSPPTTWVPRIEHAISTLKLLFKSRVFMKLISKPDKCLPVKKITR